jgi:hypothetical protein
MSEKRLFYLNPHHVGFPANCDALIADLQRRARRTILFGIGAYVLIIVTMVLIIHLRSGDNLPAGFPVLAVLLAVGIIGAVLELNNVQGQFRRLYAERQLLQGTILSAKGSARGQQGYLVELDHRFITPTGVEITHTNSAVRNDLQGQPLAGTPVHVLYINDHSHTVL